MPWTRMPEKLKLHNERQRKAVRETWQAMVDLHEGGESVRQIARTFGISPSRVSQILKKAKRDA